MMMMMMMMMMTAMTTYGCLGSFTFWGRVGRTARRCGKCCLQKSCKLVVWRSCCGLEALPRATSMPKMAPRWAANAGRRPEMAKDGPKVGREWLREALINSRGGGQALPGDLGHLVGPILGPSWAVLGLPWPFLAVLGGILRRILGLGGRWSA